MFYREAGQFKTTYAADMAIFPIRQDRYGMALILFVAFVVIPVFGNQFLINTMMIPFLILSLSAIGLNLLTGYTGLLVARNRRIHGRRRLCLLQARDDIPSGQYPRLDHRERARLGAGRRRLRPAEPAHQGLLPGGGDAGGAVLSRMVLRARALARQL